MVKLRGDIWWEKMGRLKVAVSQEDVGAQALIDLSTFLARKVPVYTKVPVPETDTGGWAQMCQGA